jgi:hypothetical protein
MNLEKSITSAKIFGATIRKIKPKCLMIYKMYSQSVVGFRHG